MTPTSDGSEPIIPGANGPVTALCQIAQASEGADPVSLILGRDGNLYGQLATGGAFGLGCIYRCSSAGEFKVLHSFNGRDGGNPIGRLFEGGDGLFYGVTKSGGIFGQGVIFSMKPSGAFVMCFSFPQSMEGARRSGCVVRTPDGSIYGVQGGGVLGQGVVGPPTIYCLTSGHTLRVKEEYRSLPSDSLAVGDDGVLYGLRVDFVTTGYTESRSVFGFKTAQIIRYAPGMAPEVIIKLPSGCSLYSQLLTDRYGTVYGMAANGRPTKDEPHPSWIYRITNGTASIARISYQPKNVPMPKTRRMFGRGSLYFGEEGRGILMIAPSGEANLINTPSSPPYSTGPQYPLTDGLAADRDGRLFGIYSSSGNPFNSVIMRREPSGGWSSIHTFNAATNPISATSGLTLGPDGALYGTAVEQQDHSIVFRWNVKEGLIILHRFREASEGAGIYGLTCTSDGELWGMACGGGPGNCGTVFRMTLKGDVKVVYSFHGPDGKSPRSRLTVGPDNELYGVTTSGGENNSGTVFRLTRSGNFTRLHSFPAEVWGFLPRSLVLGRDGWLYGIAQPRLNVYGGDVGGADDVTGAVPILFRISSSGQYRQVHSFDNDRFLGALSDLTLGSDGNLYGAAMYLTYKITSSGNYVELRNDAHKGFLPARQVNCDSGGFVEAHDGYLYQIIGRSESYATWDLGHIRRMSHHGGVCNVYDFKGSGDGALPVGRLIVGADGNLYGTATQSGPNDRNSVIFRFTPPNPDSVKETPPPTWRIGPNGGLNPTYGQ